MSKAAKMQLLELLGTLQKSNRMIGIILADDEQEGLFQLLAECQEYAITIGNKIEQIYGTGLQCVSGLEIYCEILYQITQSVEDMEGCKHLVIELERQLEMVESNMEAELIERKEVVFLPYKASMWDSLENVWKAASEDEECSVYVIPIPYYDKNPDGSLGEEHYEGGLYPAYVPITRYDEYDFEMRRPEMIFIHNPYDDANYVTSVHPFFYSKNLKRFTDKLVYIPYFILSEINPKNKAIVDNMKHFCMTPGVVHANKVFVQSEDMRQIYVNVMTELAGEHTRGYWEEKISGIGSPKIDKVLDTKIAKEEIPQNWLELIEKADGSLKKVVFYNTSVSTLLQFSDQYLTKIRDVFRVFKEVTDEVVLLWRPHPLIKSTLVSMRPALLEEYEKIVLNYKNEAWGIYDDTTDLSRSIALSDAYYGDGSSVVTLFLATGKDTMVQNPCLVYDKLMKDCLWSYDFVLEGTRIWFVPNWYNVLCCYNLITGKIEQIKDLPVNNRCNELYENIIMMDDLLILIPGTATKICIYDKLKNKWGVYDIEDVNGSVGIFATYAKWNKNVYMFPSTYSRIVKLNLEEKKLEYLEICVDKQFRMESCTVGSKVYLLIKNTNCILIYDMKKEIYVIKEVGAEEEEYYTICNIGENLFCMSTQEGSVVLWNEKTGTMDRIQNKIKDFVVDRDIKCIGAFNRSIVTEKNIYFFPGAANKVVKLSKDLLADKVLMAEDTFDDIKENRFLKFSWYSNIKVERGIIYGFDTVRKTFFSKEEKDRQVKLYTIEMYDVEDSKCDIWYDEYKREINEGHVEVDTCYLLLNDFLRRLTREQETNSRLEHLAGKRIWEYINK